MPLKKATRISDPQLAMLEKLRAVPKGKWLSVSGHAAAKCYRLEQHGFAKRQGSDGVLTNYYTITDAGCAFLSA